MDDRFFTGVARELIRQLFLNLASLFEKYIDRFLPGQYNAFAFNKFNLFF